MSWKNTKTSYMKWRPHPWHGLEAGPSPPVIVNAFVEITPFDSIKYETDKVTGYLMVDRPQPSSSLPPVVYGFIPKTFCSTRVAKLSKAARFGDEDPLDICVCSERPIYRAEVILTAKVVGVIKTIDEDKVDDKIIAVLENDAFWGSANDIKDLPAALIQRLRHYFLTYKTTGNQNNKVYIEEPADINHAYQIIKAAMDDYEEIYST